MNNDELETRVEHFAVLKTQYQASQYEDSSPSSLLYLILRKANLGIELINLEFDWLRAHQLFEAIEILQQDQQYRAEEIVKLESEFSLLKSKYNVPQNEHLGLSSHLYPILAKLDSENQLSDSEVEWLKQNNLANIASLDREMGRIAELKAKYLATKHQDSSPDSLLYKILTQLDNEEQLSDSDVNWLRQNELWETLEIFQLQEVELKNKYQATNAEEREKQRHFAELKAKYKASQYEDSSPFSHLYKVIKKIDAGEQIGEQDINFLKKRGLTETIAIAQEKGAASQKSEIESEQNNGGEDVQPVYPKKHFAALKSKYDVSGYKDKSPDSPLYAILQKLEKGERLEGTDVAWLEANGTDGGHYGYYGKPKGRKLFSGKIFTAYHEIEATFYEQEFERTKSKWHLPNASSHWRKANEPARALQMTDNLNFDKIKENKLKSALLTTRGGAFRDIGNLDDAEKCAKQAIEYQPGSHHPYTLLGAIYFERHEYSQGEYWFEEARKRGAKPEDQEREIKQIVRNTKDKQKLQELVDYLQTTNPSLYEWAKSFLKKPKDKSK